MGRNDPAQIALLLLLNQENFDARQSVRRIDIERCRTAVSQLRQEVRGQQDVNHCQDGRQQGRDTPTALARVAKDVIGTAALGAGAGTLLGIAALAIPGVGPLVAAGAIASAAIPGAALTGAAIGAAAGGVTGLLKDHGISDDDATYYEQSINDGGIFVSVDADGASLDRQSAEDILTMRAAQQLASTDEPRPSKGSK